MGLFMVSKWATWTVTQLLSSEILEFNADISPQTLKTIRDGEPRKATSTFTQLQSSGYHSQVGSIRCLLMVSKWATYSLLMGACGIAHVAHPNPCGPPAGQPGGP